MKTKLSPKQIAANQTNAQRSTGPKTPYGRSVSKRNATKHGILSKETVVRGKEIKENTHQFNALHRRLWKDLKPVGPLEEMLVDQIVTAHWRGRRVLKAEAGEIALSVDNGIWQRSHQPLMSEPEEWSLSGDPQQAMSNSALGNLFLENQLHEVRASVEQTGELTDAAIQNVIFDGKPYGLTKKLQKFRATLQSELQSNLEGLDPATLQDRQKAKIMTYLNHELFSVSLQKSDCEEREDSTETARQAAALLPSSEVLNKIMRYDTRLKRQLYHAMNQLERVQRARRGETLPPSSTKGNPDCL